MGLERKVETPPLLVPLLLYRQTPAAPASTWANVVGLLLTILFAHRFLIG